VAAAPAAAPDTGFFGWLKVCSALAEAPAPVAPVASEPKKEAA
jgi:hypothetical protein